MNNETKDEVVQLYLDDIIPNRFQPREVFDEKALKELAVSIKEHGVIQPIIVRNVNGKYEIIAGERRYKASALAGLTKIPAIIRNLDDKESSKVALLENLQRKNLNPIEEARTYQKILEIDQMTQEELAKTMGKSQSAVANKIRLLGLPDEVQEALLKEQISERHARTLLNIPDVKKQKEMLKKVISNKMSVRTLEEEIKIMYPKEPKIDINPDVISVPQPSNNIASITDFVNTNPLMPTAELPADNSNYGKITISPPEGEEMPTDLPKFINYGEIDDDEDRDDNGGPNLDITNSIPTVSINAVKAQATDIGQDNGSADLDNLLNLNNTSLISNNNDNDNYMTPAEEIVKSDPFVQTEKIEDYFKTPDLNSINIPMSVPLGNPEPASTPMELNQKNLSQEVYTIELATDKIRNLVTELKEHGIKVNTDEMNFEKSYQIIIKLDKTQ